MTGLFGVLSYEPPAWMIPEWLKEMEAEAPSEHRHDWFDRATLSLGWVFVVGGVATVLGGVLLAATSS